jgi:spore maturation protein CgeB
VYDISFVGTLHSNRYELISKVFKDFDKKFLFLFFTAKWLFLINKVFRKDYYKISWNEVSFEKINKNEVAKIFKNSKAVLDIQRNHQSGLTMRTFEVLASGSILITFNKNITKTNFYNSDRIFVINEDIPPSEVEILKEKIQKQNLAHNESIPSQYFLENHYLENWVKEFFS